MAVMVAVAMMVTVTMVTVTVVMVVDRSDEIHVQSQVSTCRYMTPPHTHTHTSQQAADLRLFLQ